MPYKTPWLKDKNAGIVKIRNAVGDTTTQTGNPVSVDNEFGLGEVDSLSVALSPVQNLNGYDSPWIGGAGKNKLPSHAVGSTTISGVTFTVNADGTITVNGTATAEAQYAITFSNLTGNYYFGGCPSGGSSTAYELYAWDYTASARFKKWNGTTASDSDFGTGSKEISIPSGHNGSLSIRIRNGYTANNLVFKPMIRLASVTDDTYEPYSNICPITGHTSASVTRTGKNLLQINNNVNTYTHNGVTYTFDRDSQGNLLSITADGTATGGNSFVVFSVLPNMQYLVGLGKPIKLSGASNEGGRARLQWWNYNGNGATAGDNGNGSSAFIPTSTAGNVAIQVYNNETVHNAVYKPMILLADETDRTYEPYTGNTYTIDLNGTRYGGTVDLATGVLTVTHVMWTDSGTGWVMNDNGSFYKAYSPSPTSVQTADGCACNYAPYAISYSGMAVFARPNGLISLGNGWGSVYPDVASLQAAFASTPIQVVYKLATPQTYQLTPQQISLLTGVNYISSSDEVSVTVTLPGWTSLIDPSKIKHDIYDLDAGNTTGRNLAGEMLRDRVAVKEKLNMEFPPMVADDYYAMLNLIKDQFFDVQYYSPFTGGKRVATMYVGDREGEPYYDYDVNDLGDNMWTNVKFNFIER